MRVHAISTGTVRVTTRQQRGVGPGPLRPLLTMLDRSFTGPLPVHVWVIEHPEGVIVVDAGETARVSEPGWFPRWHPYFRLAVKLDVKPDDEVGPQLRGLGIDPGEVSKVVLTHLHTDHSGGLEHFKGVEILCSRTEHELATGFVGKLRGFVPHRWPDWFEPTLVDFPAEPFGPFTHTLPITEAGDVRIVATPGHTPGHVSVVVDEGDQLLFLAGDTSYTAELLMEGVLDGIAPDAKTARATNERIRELALQRPTVYLASHDPGAAARLEARRPVGA